MAVKAEPNHKQSTPFGIPQATSRAARLPEVLQLTGKSKTAIYQDMRDGKFPAGFLIGKRARAWMLSDVMEWLDSRKASGGV